MLKLVIREEINGNNLQNISELELLSNYKKIREEENEETIKEIYKKLDWREKLNTAFK